MSWAAAAPSPAVIKLYSLMRRYLLISLLASGSWLLAVSPTYAQTTTWLGTDCVGRNVSGAYNVATIQGLECLFSNILSIAITGLGLIMFVLIIVGGFKYLTAGGDPKALESAKGTLTWAIIGLVVAILAWFILQAISNLTGITDLLHFTTQFPLP